MTAPATSKSAVAKAHYWFLSEQTRRLDQVADPDSEKNLLSQCRLILLRGASKKAIPIFPHRLEPCFYQCV